MRKYSFFTFCLLWAGTLLGQELLTAEQAVEVALKNNYDILIARNAAEIAQRNNTVGNAGMLPRINATVTDNFTLNNLNQQFANGSEFDTTNVRGNTVNAGIQLNWTLFDGLRMFATKGRLKRLEEIGELQFKEEVQGVVANVLLAYYDVVRAKQQLTAINEAIKISEERVKLADVKFQVGNSSKVDLLQAKVDLNAQKSNAMNQALLIEQRKADLNNLLSRNADTPFDVTDSIPFNAQLADAGSDLEQKNFQILSAAKNVEVARFAKKEAFAGFLPNLSGNVGYGYNRNQSGAGFSLFNQTYGLNAGFSLSIPLFNGLNTLRENKIATIQIQTSEFNLEKVRFQTKANYYRTLQAFVNAQQLLKLEEENIALADENQKIATERFRLAQSTSIEFREAQKSYIDALTRLVNARYAAKTAETELLRLKGELVK